MKEFIFETNDKVIECNVTIDEKLIELRGTLNEGALFEMERFAEEVVQFTQNGGSVNQIEYKIKVFKKIFHNDHGKLNVVKDQQKRDWYIIQIYDNYLKDIIESVKEEKKGIAQDFQQ